MHLYLAEYHRAVIVHVDGHETARMQMFEDTGGYSRSNLYRLTDGNVLLRDAFDSYLIDPGNGSIAKDATRRAGGAFLGSFDVNDAGDWMFIPASDRAERPTELRGGS